MKQLLKIIDIRRDVRESLHHYFSVYLKSNMDVYDIGCGSKPFSKFLKGRVKRHIGVDIDDGFYDSSHIDVIGSAYKVPVEDHVADSIISSQVLEHLNDPIAAITEMERLLKPGGLLFLSFPFLYPIHAGPHDHLRYTEYYIEDLLKRYGFSVIERSSIGGFWYCVGMYSGIYLQNIDRGIVQKVMLIKVLSIILRWGFNAIHCLEGALLKAMRKDVARFRKEWTVNYTYVLKKENLDA